MKSLGRGVRYKGDIAMRTYKKGKVVFGNWSVVRLIGEGSFGSVYELGREDFDITYKAAMKVISVPRNDAELRIVQDEGMDYEEARNYFYSVVKEIVNEFALMSKVKGITNIVGYEDHQVIAHEDGLGWDILIRMELLTPLMTYVYQHPFTRRDVIRLGIDICRALELCQKYNIIHRDIKPENIFVSENGDFELGDFGIARTIEKTMCGLSQKGTYSYMAPEIYKGMEYGFSVDIYSLGIVLYRLLNQNRVPFMPPAPTAITYSAREKALTMRMRGEQMELPYYGEGRLPEIVLKACAYNPKDRYSSPTAMRQELEAIQYDIAEAEVIYPTGDKIVTAENIYISKTPAQLHRGIEDLQRTESVFAPPVEDNERTESGFVAPEIEDNAKGIVVEERVATKFAPKNTEKVEKKKIKKEIAIGILILLCIMSGAYIVGKKMAKEAIINLDIITNEPVIAQAIRDVLDMPAETITQDDLDSITSLTLSGEHISDISGIETLTNLTYLDLSSNAISDISALETLTNLTELRLGINEISDISVLENLTNLEMLYLSYNELSDISSLLELSNLELLYLFGNDITDWTPVEYVEKVYK